MQNVSLFPETTVRSDGFGPPLEVNPETSKLLVLTLGITCTIERESLEVSISGSEDGENWSLKPLARFTQKSYCGLYSILLNMGAHPGVRYLRTQWKISRWRKPVSTPLFGFYVDVQESGSRMLPASVSRAHSAVA